MAFNHYAKIRRILAEEAPGWYVRRIPEPTTSTNFKGEITRFEYYYRIYRADGIAIKYCKFQQLQRFASIMRIDLMDIPIVE